MAEPDMLDYLQRQHQQILQTPNPYAGIGETIAGAIQGYNQGAQQQRDRAKESLSLLAQLTQRKLASGDQSGANDTMGQIAPLLKQAYGVDVPNSYSTTTTTPTVQQTLGGDNGVNDNPAGRDYSPVDWQNGGAVPTAQRTNTTYNTQGMQNLIGALIPPKYTTIPAYGKVINDNTGQVIGEGGVKPQDQAHADYYDFLQTFKPQQLDEKRDYDTGRLDQGDRRLDQGDRRMDQGDRRLDQGDTRNKIGQQNADSRSFTAKVKAGSDAVAAKWAGMDLRISTNKQHAYQQADGYGQKLLGDPLFMAGQPEDQRQAAAKLVVDKMKSTADSMEADQRGRMNTAKGGGSQSNGGSFGQQMVDRLTSIQNRQQGKAPAPARQ